MIEELEARLDDFDKNVRKNALLELIKLKKDGKVKWAEEKEISNMHCHSFFSFNGYGYSPMKIAWLCKKNGIKLCQIVDFDVLDGIEELFYAANLLNLRASVGIETRVFIPEFKNKEINSPGEPGIYYLMGVGFTKLPSHGSPAHKILTDMSHRAHMRTRKMVDILNEYLDDISVKYDTDVISLTPNGNVTERHILKAFYNKSKEIFKETESFTSYWASKLHIQKEDINNSLDNPHDLCEIIRSKLMKKGGIAYIEPDVNSFPHIETAIKMITELGGIPCATWLNGLSDGEKNLEELLDLLISKGISMMNIIPDRNYNIRDKEEKRNKVKNLYKAVEIAKKLNLPIIAGTEMNKFGQKLVDDFNSKELSPIRKIFMDGAYFLYDHTLRQRKIKKIYKCHCEERSDVAILKDEIASPSVRNDRREIFR
ncbi:hypothetical protein KAW08_00885 [bacterium]|nr:hypothetical protein [bacterium]